MLKRFMTVCCLLCFAALCQAAPTISNTSLSVALDNTTGTATLRTANSQTVLASNVGLQLWNGKTKTQVSLSVGDIQKATEKITSSAQGDDIEVQNKVYFEGKVLFWEADIVNHQNEQVWLEARLAGDYMSSAVPSFYNVMSIEEPATKPLDAQTTRWPAMALYSQQNGFWVGTDPHQLFSLLTYQLDGASSGKAKPFAFGARIVLDPGQRETVRFTILPFTPRQGHRSALQAYYDAFPDLFWPTPGIDPRFVQGASAHGTSWRHAATEGHTSGSEVPRRSSASWDWMYGPVIFPGDSAMRKERWKVIPPERRSDRAQTWEQVEAFREVRQKYFYNADVLYNIAPAFYTINWAHEDLVRELWPDSPMTSDTGWENREGSRLGWIAREGYVKNGPWSSVEIFPWGTSAGKAFKQDYVDLVKGPLNFTGFTFDSNVAAGKYRGPKMNTLPGRAWDDEGVFVAEGVAQSLMADYIHSLHNQGYRMAVVANQPASYYGCAFRIDAFILEISWNNILTSTGNIIGREYARAQVGHKPRTIYTQFYDISAAISMFKGWENMSPQQIHQTMLAANDRLLIFALAYGWNLFPDMVMPDVRMQHYVSIVADLVSRGWQPVSGMSSAIDSGISFSRYGDDIESYLAIGNNNTDAQELKIQLDTTELSHRRIFYTGYNGAAVPMQYHHNSGTFAIKMAPLDVQVLRSALVLDGGNGILKGQAQRTGDAHSGQITVDINADMAQTTSAKLILPDGMKLDSLTVNGVAIKDVQVEKNMLSFPLHLALADNNLVARYHSTKVLSPSQTILDFEFLDKKTHQPTSQIVVPEDASDALKGVAFRLSEYFRYWSVMNFDEEVHLPIVTTADPEIANRIVISNSSDISKQGVVVDGKVLSITGKDDLATAGLMNQVMTILDQKYQVVTPFTNQINYDNRPFVGRHISARDRKSNPWIPEDLPKAIETIFRKGDIWNKPLRFDMLPAGAQEASQFLEMGQIESSREILFDAARIDSDEKAVTLVHDKGKITIPAKGALLRVDSIPTSDAVSLFFKLSKDDLKGVKKVHIPIRLISPAATPARRFILSIRNSGEWSPRTVPQFIDPMIDANQWTTLIYDISDDKIGSETLLRLYFGDDAKTKSTFEVGEITVSD